MRQAHLRCGRLFAAFLILLRVRSVGREVGPLKCHQTLETIAQLLRCCRIRHKHQRNPAIPAQAGNQSDQAPRFMISGSRIKSGMTGGDGDKSGSPSASALARRTAARSEQGLPPRNEDRRHGRAGGQGNPSASALARRTAARSERGLPPRNEDRRHGRAGEQGKTVTQCNNRLIAATAHVVRMIVK